MKILPTSFAFLLFICMAFASCNNNQGKGNDTTSAGTERSDGGDAPSENRTPSPSLTTDSTGATSPAINNPAHGSDTATTATKTQK